MDRVSTDNIIKVIQSYNESVTANNHMVLYNKILSGIYLQATCAAPLLIP